MRAYTTNGELIELTPGLPLAEGVKCYFIVVTSEEVTNTNVPLELTFNYEQEIDGVKSATYNLSYITTVGDDLYYTCTWYPIKGIGELDDSGTGFDTATLDTPVLTDNTLTNDPNLTTSWQAVPRADTYRVVLRYADIISNGSYGQYRSDTIYDIETSQTSFTPTSNLTPITSIDQRPIGADGSLPDGKYSITVKAMNSAGEYSDYVSDVFEVKTKQQGPNSWYQLPVTTRLSLNGADPIPHWSWNMYGGTHTNLTVLKSSTATGTYTTVKTLQVTPNETGYGTYTLDETDDGFYKISVVVEDSLGNLSDAFEYYTSVELDSTPPAVVTNLAASLDGTTANVSWVASQETTRVQIEIQYTDHSTNYGTTKLAGDDTTYSTNLPYETNFTIGVRVSDDLDNWSDLVTTQITTPAAPPEPPVNIYFDKQNLWSWGPVLPEWEEVEYQLNDGAIVRSGTVPSGVTGPDRESYLNNSWNLNYDDIIDRTDGLNVMKVRVIVDGTRSEWRESPGESITSRPGSITNLTTTSTESPVKWTWSTTTPEYDDIYYVVKINDVEQNAELDVEEFTAELDYGTHTISVEPYRLDADEDRVYNGNTYTNSIVLTDPSTSGPYNIENLPYLFRYQSGDVTGTSTVETWTDSSGNGYDLIPRYSARPPTATTSGGANFNVDRVSPLWNADATYPDSFCVYLVLKGKGDQAAINRGWNIKYFGGPKIYDNRSEPQQSFSVGASQYTYSGNPTLLPVEYISSSGSVSWQYPRISVSSGHYNGNDKSIMVVVWQKNAANIFAGFSEGGGSSIKKTTSPNSYSVTHPGIELAGGMFGDYAANIEVFEFGAFELTSEITDLHNETSVVVDKTVAELASRNNITTNAIYWNNPYIT